MSLVEPPFEEKDIGTDAVSKKDIVTFLQTHASEKFKGEHKLKGTLVNVAKVKTKDQLIKDYKEFFETKAFRTAEDDSTESKPKENVRKPQQKDAKHVETKPKAVPVKKAEEVKYQKKILKVGDKCTFPNKGEEVGCYYTGKLSDGKVFDTNVPTDKNAKKTNPLKFKVGTGKVIRGWDEAIQSMSLGEKAEVVIHPDWAYGKKGLEGKIPPNSQLTFEIELVTIA